jgi:hypothetical protein
MNADQAIERSISHNEIVTIEWDAETESQLSMESDDTTGWMTEGDIATCEFWGGDEGEEWRVHLTREVAQ